MSGNCLIGETVDILIFGMFPSDAEQKQSVIVTISMLMQMMVMVTIEIMALRR